MPFKDKEKKRAYARQYYADNLEKAKAASRAFNKRHPGRKSQYKYPEKERLYRLTFRSITRNAKSVPCADCGVSYPAPVMDFHHVRGKKTGLVSRLGSMAAVVAEIEKCVVLCANCHRLRHMRPEDVGSNPALASAASSAGTAL